MGLTGDPAMEARSPRHSPGVLRRTRKDPPLWNQLIARIEEE